MVAYAPLRTLRSSATATAIIGSLVLALASCEKVPLVAPSGTAITLVASTNVLPVNGSATIVAVLVQGGESSSGTTTTTSAGTGVVVHNGTLVTFTTSLGTIQPIQARTTDGGKATVTLSGDGRSGTATVTAFSGAAKQTLTVLIGAAAAARVQVTASPQALPPTGGTSTITATVQDQQGNGLLGVPVNFSTSAGTLGATSGLTDSSGNTTTTLTTTQGPATVTASAGGGTSALSGTVVVTLKPATTVTITPPATATVSTPAAFTITVGANTIVTDVSVDYGDGSSVDVGALTGSTTVQHFFGDSGVFTVTATATDSTGAKTKQSTQVAVAPLVAIGSASPSSVLISNPVTFTVSVTPTNASISQYVWDFGEGDPPLSTGNQVSHLFVSKGFHTVSVHVIPLVGQTLVVLIQVSVN
jgi:hypothetical protein